MSFADQKSHVVDEKYLNLSWNGDKGTFRCYLCGHRFKIGDIFRWILCLKFGNFIVCEKCDGSDVIDRWEALKEEAKDEKFWWFWRQARIQGEQGSY